MAPVGTLADILIGFGYHADFMTGWDVDFLQQAINTCTNPSGKIEDCPIFTLQSEDTQKQCSAQVPAELANEKVAGIVGAVLPGGVSIQFGPEPAVPGQQAPHEPQLPPTTTVAVPTVGYSAGIEPTDTNYQPGQIFKEHSSSIVDSSSTGGVAALAEPAITPAPEPPVEDDGYEIVRTDYVTVGNLVSMIIVKEKVEYVTVTTTTATSTVTVDSLKARYQPHMHRHGRRHLHR